MPIIQIKQHLHKHPLNSLNTIQFRLSIGQVQNISGIFFEWRGELMLRNVVLLTRVYNI